jgi:hypothetical protein
MKTQYWMAALLALAVASPAVLSAQTESLAEGKYTATLTPSVDKDAADKIKSELKKVDQIKDIDVKPEDGSLHFTVKDGEQVETSAIESAVKTAAPGTNLSAPMPEAGNAAGDSGTMGNEGTGTTGSDTGTTGTGDTGGSMGTEGTQGTQGSSPSQQDGGTGSTGSGY